MKSTFAMELSKVTEAAALAGYKWLGRGDKNAADFAAVQAMRAVLNETEIGGEIVIGEGEIDDAPMLYIGEKVGLGGELIDIAVDPIEGTSMTAMGQSNALAVIAAGDKGCFLKAPDMYMEKLVVGARAKGCIDLNIPLAENLKNIAQALGKNIGDLVIVTLDKERHIESINVMQSMGVRVFSLPDGDVSASILVCLDEYGIDAMYCIGGAPEGVVTAAIVRALDGDMNARLLPRHKVKGNDDENYKIGQLELQRCVEMGVEAEVVLKLEDMVKSDDVAFAATGITKGDLLEGVTQKGSVTITDTLIIEGKSPAIKRIKSNYYSNHNENLSTDVF